MWFDFTLVMFSLCDFNLQWYHVVIVMQALQINNKTKVCKKKKSKIFFWILQIQETREQYRTSGTKMATIYWPYIYSSKVLESGTGYTYWPAWWSFYEIHWEWSIIWDGGLHVFWLPESNSCHRLFRPACFRCVEERGINADYLDLLLKEEKLTNLSHYSRR